jgi:hypothetical protein
VQRAVEARGIPTVSLSVAKDVSLRLLAPRVLFLPFMMGHHFGVPFHSKLQRRIILAALEHLTQATQSGEVRTFPVTWAEARRQGKEIEAAAAASSER